MTLFIYLFFVGKKIKQAEVDRDFPSFWFIQTLAQEVILSLASFFSN